MVPASHYALCIKISVISRLGAGVLCGGSGMWNGQGCMVILGLEPSGILAIPGLWAGLRQARSSGTTFGGCTEPLLDDI